jgi:hypothetical protein
MVLNSTPILDTLYETSIDPKLGLDTVYFVITALDQSLTSTIKQLNPTPQGIRVAWALDKSKYAKSYILQRKPVYINTWTNVNTFDTLRKDTLTPRIASDIFTMHYLDTASTLEPIIYEYRINTIDIDGHLNPGTSIQTKPNLTAAVSGNISGLTTTETSFRAGHLSDIAINWSYTTSSPQTLEEFQIFISNPSSDDPTFYLHKTILSPQSAPTTSGFTTSGGQYGVKATIEKKAGTNFQSLPLRYKIVAIHKGGITHRYEGEANKSQETTK